MPPGCSYMFLLCAVLEIVKKEKKENGGGVGVELGGLVEPGLLPGRSVCLSQDPRCIGLFECSVE